MSNAPSERHLEDWIVAHPGRVADATDWYDDDESLPYIEKIIGRQVSLPAGRCDLIVTTHALAELSVAVLEIKKGPINSDTVAQTLRYMRDMREIFYWTRTSPQWSREIHHYAHRGIFEFCNGSAPEVSGLVIGHTAPDINLRIACEASGIVCLTYEWTGSEYLFSYVQPYEDESTHERYHRYEVYKQFASGAIGDAFRDAMQERASLERRRKEGRE